MPLPLIPLLIGGSLLGIGKGAKAVIDNKEASRVNEDAKEIMDNAKERIDLARKAAGKALSFYGSAKVCVYIGSLKDFVNEFSKIKNVDFTDTLGLSELSDTQLSVQDINEMREMSSMVLSLAGGLAGGVAGGALTAFGAFSAVGALGTAGTGTAIGTLVGVAKLNATLAWLGGDSLLEEQVLLEAWRY